MTFLRGNGGQQPANNEEPSDDEPGVISEENENEPGIEEEGEAVTTPPGEGEDDGKGGEGHEGDDDKPKYTFKSEDELNDFIKSRQTPTTPAVPPTPTTTEKPTEPAKKEPRIFFKGQIDKETGKWVGEAPADWNDLANKIVDFLTSDEQKMEVVSFMQNMTVKERKEIEDINAEFDAEYKGLAAQGLVPKLDTKEGTEVNKIISLIGGTYGLTSMKAAYDLAKKIPASEGGLLGYKPTTVTKKPNPSKQASRLIKSSTRTNPTGKKGSTIPYSKLHGTHIDNLLEED